MGRNHDGIVVWHEQAVAFYLALTVVSIVINILIVVFYRRKNHNENT
jgi:hypothetical protein